MKLRHSSRLLLKLSGFRIPVSAFLLLLAAAPLHAQSSWNGNGTTAWGLDTNWTPNTVPDSTTATATFNGTITTQPTIGASNYTVKALTVGSSSDNVTLSGSTGLLTFDTGAVTAAPTVLDVAAGKSLTIGSNVTFLTSGAITWAPTALLGTGSELNFDSGKTLTVTGGNSRTVNFSGNGTTNFNSKFAGTPGKFQVANNGVLNFDPDSGSAANFALNAQTGGTINILNTNTVLGAISFDASGSTASGKVYFRTTGSFTQNTTTTFSGSATVGTSILGFDEATNATAEGVLGNITTSANNGGITNQLYTGANKTLVTGTISAGGATNFFEKAGAGTVRITGTNSFTGTTRVSEGTLTIVATTALNGFNTSGRYSVANGAALAVYNAVSEANITAMLGTTNFAAGASIGFDTTTADRTYTANLGNTGQGALGLVKAGANDLTLTGTTTYTGDTTIRSGILKIGTSGSLGSGNYAGKITNNGFLFYTSSANQTLSGNITGTGAINKNTSTSTLTLTGNNSYTNYTYVSAGTLLINGNQTAATGGVTVAAGGTLGGNGTIGGLVTVDNNGILSPGTTADATTTLTLNTKNLTISGADSKINLNITGTADGAFDRIAGINVFAQGGDITFALTGSYVDGDLWNVFGFVSKSGTFNSVALTGDYTGSLNWDGTNWTNTNIDGQSWKFDEAAGRLSVIPEPATWALLAVSLTVVTILRRRRNS